MTELLDIHDLQKLFKLGRTATWQLTRSPDFPAPSVLSSTCYRWWPQDVKAFLRSRKRPTPATAPKPRPSADGAQVVGTARPRRRRARDGGGA